MDCTAFEEGHVEKKDFVKIPKNKKKCFTKNSQNIVSI